MQSVVPQNKARKGFTLVELIVVIAILAVLAAAAIAGYSGMTQQARDAQHRSNAAAIVTAVNNHNSIADDFYANNLITAIPPSFLTDTSGNILTWDISIGAGTAPAGTGSTVAQTASGPVDLTIRVSMSGPEWAAASAYVNSGGSIWTLKN